MDASYGYGMAEARARRGTLVGQVMGLLAFSLLFTAGGAALGRALGPGAIILSIVGSIGCLIGLFFARSRPGLNLALFYAFSVFEGMALGLIIESYVARGMGGVVRNAAFTTGGLVMVLGGYAWTTKRDLSGLGGYLMAGLIGVIVAGLVPGLPPAAFGGHRGPLQRLRPLRHPAAALRRRHRPVRRRLAGDQHLPRHLQPLPGHPAPVRLPQQLGRLSGDREPDPLQWGA